MSAEQVEKLKEARDEAWGQYQKLQAPADKAYKDYEAAKAAYNEAVLYAKIKRKVMRDILNQASNSQL